MRASIFQWAGVSVVGAALALIMTGCHSSNDVVTPPAGGGASSVVVSASNPASGDGTITALGTLAVNNGGSGKDELNLSETGHDLTVLWDTNTHAIFSIQHGWGAGMAQCVGGGATPCDPAKVAIDFTGHTVTFTALTLPDDPFATGSTCTLNGTAIW
jgi:hypothetical protein